MCVCTWTQRIQQNQTKPTQNITNKHNKNLGEYKPQTEQNSPYEPLPVRKPHCTKQFKGLAEEDICQKVH